MTCSGPWPRANLSTTGLLGNDLAIELVEDAKSLHDLMAEQKARMFQKAEQYVEAVLAEYNAKKRKNSRGTFTAESLDDRFKVELSIANLLRVNANVMAAHSLMTEVLNDLTEDVRPEIRMLLEAAYVPDEKTGRVSVERLKQVRNVSLPHPRWGEVLKAVADSIEVAGSRPYLRFYWREDRRDDWQPIVLQFSSIPVKHSVEETAA